MIARIARAVRPRPLAAVCEDRQGVTAVEFGMITPVFVIMLLGIFDIGFAMYAKAVLQGAVEEGARRASLENTHFHIIEQRVNSQVRGVIPASDPETDISFEFDPKYYANYSDVELPEDFTDSNNNKSWDPNECFIDRNANSSYDTDVGIAGRGGAQDVVAITAKLTFRRVFPLWTFLDQPQDYTLEAKTYLRNQPFTAQASRVGVRICP